MLLQLLSAMTPELIIHSVKQNPKIFLETLHKFESFKLIASSLTKTEQETISSNIEFINDFLRSDSGKTSIHMIAEEFVNFISERIKPSEEDKLRNEIEFKYRAELEEKIRGELMANAIGKLKR